MAEGFAGVLDEFVTAVAQNVEFGRESGPGFWRRFAPSLDVLDRVAGRDDYFAAWLERLEAEEAERAARLLEEPAAAA